MSEDEDAIEQLMLHYDSTLVLASANNDDNDNNMQSIADRFRPGGVLSVTDLCAPLWCPLQFYFDLCKTGRRPDTHAMKETHLELERELHEPIAVTIESNADAWGVRLLNLLGCLQELQSIGMTREMPLFGRIADILTTNENQGGSSSIIIVGVADELRMDNAGQLHLKEYKTRRRNCYPNVSQRTQTRLQLMLYRRLLMRLPQTLIAATTAELLTGANDEFSPQFIAQLALLMPELAQCSLDQLIRIAGERSAIVFHANPISEEMEVEYIIINNNREERQSLPVETITDDYDRWRELIAKAQMFWFGIPVVQAINSLSGVEDVEDAWKCTACPHSDHCHWRQQKAGNARQRI